MKELFEFDSEDYFYLRIPVLNNKHFSDVSDFLSFVKTNKVFKESLKIASAPLYAELIKMEFSVEPGNKKLVSSIYKYYLRMSHRSTPFGLFSGCAVGYFSDRNDIAISDLKSHRPHVQIDINFIWDIIDKLNKRIYEGEFHSKVRYFPNTTIYESSNGFRYLEFRQNFKEFHISSFQIDDYLKYIFSFSKHGKTIDEIAVGLSKFAEVDLVEAKEFTFELIQNSLLLNDLYPRIISNDTFELFLKQIQEIDPVLCETLKIIDLKRKEISDFELGESIENYEILDRLGEELDISSYKPYKVDLRISTLRNTIDTELLSSLKEAVTILYCAQYHKYKREHTDLNGFKERFQKLYGEKRIPFLTALDPDNGLGYPVDTTTNEIFPLLNGLSFGPIGKNYAQEHIMDEWDFYLLNLVRVAFENGKDSIEIEEKAVETWIRHREFPLAESFYSNCTFVKKEDSDEVLIAHNVTSGPSISRNLGRFTNMDSTLENLVRATTQKEDSYNPDCIYAEISYIVNQRGVNISNRAPLRRYELSLYPIDNADEYVIQLKDLLIEVVNGRIVLFSKRLGKRIIPRLSSAHAPYDSLPHYRFLVELQKSESYNQFFWDWGTLANSNFLPRVLYKNIILSPARWQLNINDFDTVGNNIDSLKSLLSKFKVKKSFLIAFADNYLPIDQENEISLNIFWEYLKQFKSLLCLENVQHHNTFVKSALGYHNNEVIIPWSLKNPYQEKPIFSINSKQIECFNPGSEWLYVKVYLNHSNADFVISRIIYPFTIKLLQKQSILKWFFIRYNDNIGSHLRIRFHLFTETLFGEVYSELLSILSPYINENKIWRVSLDVYDRELKRYGYDNIENSEDYFYYDSVCVSQYLVDHSNQEETRWKFAIKGVDNILESFNLSFEQRMKITSDIAFHFKEEFLFSDKTRQFELDKKFRMMRKEIESALTTETILAFCNPILGKDNNISQLTSRIRLTEMGRDSFNELLASYIHMFLNRVFRKLSRQQEMVIYEFLSRYYVSSLARVKKNVTV